MGKIIFDGKSSDNYGIVVEVLPDYSSAEKNVEFVDVPGRNGQIAIDNGTYKTVERKYNIACGKDAPNEFKSSAKAISQWLNRGIGFCRLEDSYEPEIYRMAAYAGPTDISNIYGMAGRAEITFTCQPERYLKSGEVPIKLEASSMKNDKSIIVKNSTEYTSKPIINVFIKSINATDSENCIITITIAESYRLQLKIPKKVQDADMLLSGDIITIDCDSCAIYLTREPSSGGISIKNLEQYVDDSVDETFPIEFDPGTTKLKLTTEHISCDAEVLPRWWTI